MSRSAEPSEESAEQASAIARRLQQSGKTLAVAESLTSGAVASSLGAAEGASEWFRGGVIAYASEVKFDVLKVPEGPVITAECAEQMASGVADLLGADIGLALTGAGGPGPEEGQPSGTVFISVQGAGIGRTDECHFPGDPAEVVQASTLHSLRMLAQALDAAAAPLASSE